MTRTASSQKPKLSKIESAENDSSSRTFVTRSGIDLPAEHFTAETLRGWDPAQKLGQPGEYPYTRGIHADMYRKRPWTIRHNAGFGSGENTNALFKYLFKNGLTGLNLATDLPTQMGIEPDDPRGQFEAGRVGVALSTLEDMERLYEGIPLDQVSTSTAHNGMAIVFLAQYVLAAQAQGVPPSAIRGTVQNDILKEILARGTYIFPPRPSIRLAADVIEWCINNAPKFNPISVSACHMQQAGATHIQSFAYTFANAQVYLDELIRRGYSVDQVAPLFSFLIPSTVNFFEAAANHRAARRLWASILKEKYGAKDPRSWMLRAATAGDQTELTAAQPLNNLARITLHCLGAALGGSQSIILAAYDEAFDIPTEKSFRATLMAQNIVQRESGVADVVDPLAGSYYVEWLTDRSEQEMRAILQKIADAGGMVKAIEAGIVQRDIARQAYEEERRIQSGQKARVGVNCLVVKEEEGGMEHETFSVDPDLGRRHIERLKEIRRQRDQGRLTLSLEGLKKAAADESQNLVPHVMEAVRCMATGGEIAGVLREVFGTYKPPTGV
ncbi:MAG: methylmalonyl-CoA mutase [Betaproteobacteria bacterium]|nr:MAG: methylmalonyl-CoA mutase [Betaproteobacteria bacterium]